MISLIGIFVITSSACYTTPPITTTEYFKDIPIVMSHREKISFEKFIRVSSSAVVAHNEIALPVCDWIDHKWIEILRKVDNGIVTYLDFKREIQQCIYCDKKRIKKEVWEDVK